jgi:alkylation response protein AidB-like acyl-CoA dehydrogenase
MDFNLTKEQQMLNETLQSFAAKEYSFETRRKILRSTDGLSREVWSTLAQMGLLSLQVPEEHGGMGAAGIETMLTMQAMGRALLLEPYLESAILATALIRDLGSSAQKKALLPALAAGELIAVPAQLERGSRYDLNRVATTAVRRGEGYILNGAKTLVVHAGAADLLIVSARTNGNPEDEAGISLFAIERGAKGISLENYPTLDGRRAADVTFRDAHVPNDALLGTPGGAYPDLAAAWDLGIAAVCAEAMGALEAIFQQTVEYTKTRKQFDVPISRFQALQHRMVDMLIHVEQAKSMAYLAAMRSGERDPAARARAISAAKVRIGQACRSVGQEAVQLHGGMGVTEELSVSHYFRRLTAIELSFGDTEHHLEKFAASQDPALS